MVVGILQAIAEFCLRLVETMGYAGVFFLMVLESMVFPVPSEAVLPPAGWLAYEGRMSFWLAALAATLGTIVGSLLSYAMGAYGVRPLLERYGKYVLVTPHHIAAAHDFFEGRSATLAIFASRFVPVVRHLISIPAGGARMPLPHFVLATTAGGFLWNITLLYAGFKLGENWRAVTAFVEAWKWPVFASLVVLAAAAGIWWWVRRRRDGPVPQR